MKTSFEHISRVLRGNIAYSSFTVVYISKFIYNRPAIVFNHAIIINFFQLDSESEVC